ncbi:hypothetical protein ACFQL1_07025 [Halomicroarcula sp. GCM10025709]|nr:hypothetical protein [Halomicroarcula sp. YJ-61-S]
MSTEHQAVDEQPPEHTTDDVDIDAEHQEAQATGEVFEGQQRGGR